MYFQVHCIMRSQPGRKDSSVPLAFLACQNQVYHVFPSFQQNASISDKETPFCKESIVRAVGIAQGWGPPSTQISQQPSQLSESSYEFTFQVSFILVFGRILTVEI